MFFTHTESLRPSACLIRLQGQPYLSNWKSKRWKKLERWLRARCTVSLCWGTFNPTDKTLFSDLLTLGVKILSLLSRGEIKRKIKTLTIDGGWGFLGGDEQQGTTMVCRGQDGGEWIPELQRASLVDWVRKGRVVRFLTKGLEGGVVLG